MNRHSRLIKLGLDTNPFYASKVIAEYACSQSRNSLSHAHQVFDQVPFNLKDTALWASLISAYSRSHQPHKALHLFSHMLLQPQPAPHAQPNSYVFTSVARAIASAPEQHLCLGQTLHAHVIKYGYIPNDVVVETALLHMYAKCGVLTYACKLFDEMPLRNLVTWNAMISGLVQNGMEINGFELFTEMKCLEIYAPDQFTVATVLSGCAGVRDLILGKQVHGFAIVSGFESNCSNAIATMYFDCGEVGSGEKFLDGIGGDVFMMLIKIRGYVSNAKYSDALKCISSAHNSIVILYQDHTVIVPLLTACSKLSLLRVGKQLHGLLITLGESFEFNLSDEDGEIIGCALIDMYSKCGDVFEARRVFDHLLPQHISHGNSMVLGYIYNGLIGDARALLEIMPEKNVVSWTSMMTGYVRSGKPNEGLNLLTKMYSNEEGLIVNGNCLTFVVGLEACSSLTDLEKGKQIHAKTVRMLVSADISNVVIGTALIDMYSKSGKLNYAQRVFDLMVEKNAVAWTSIIMGYAVHGLGFDALKLFQQMIGTGFEPNEVTFIAVLTACSHSGLVDSGLQYFKMMKKYNLVPREDHQTCLIDMLGRFGRLDEAFHLLEETEATEWSGEPSRATAWAALLGACHLHGNVKLGEKVAKKMLVNGKQISTTHVTLSNVYAAAGLWDEAYGVRESWRKEGNINGEPGLTSISMHMQNS
ncbi:hypothetical protein ACH5RR_020377 [Cinchona calisaya]|uniref:Pentatricopeptide repeat-containing protein n=1 Tax=Cinchona calisaya TaxID=153742 RepID=A0ABD2ZJ96_9GENT